MYIDLPYPECEPISYKDPERKLLSQEPLKVRNEVTARMMKQSIEYSKKHGFSKKQMARFAEEMIPEIMFRAFTLNALRIGVDFLTADSLENAVREWVNYYTQHEEEIVADYIRFHAKEKKGE